MFSRSYRISSFQIRIYSDHRQNRNCPNWMKVFTFLPFVSTTFRQKPGVFGFCLLCENIFVISYDKDENRLTFYHSLSHALEFPIIGKTSVQKSSKNEMFEFYFYLFDSAYLLCTKVLDSTVRSGLLRHTLHPCYHHHCRCR